MRKFTLALLTLFCLASCEKTETNNNNNNQANGTIVGTWKLTSVTSALIQEGYIDPSSGNQVYTYSEDLLQDWTVPNVYWVFNNNNSLIEYYQYSISDNQLMWDTTALSYTYERNSLEIFQDGENIYGQITINTLNDNTFDFSAISVNYYSKGPKGDTLYFEQINLENMRYNKSTLPEIDNPRLSLKKNNLFFKKEK